jgi:hypothetical protein
MEDWMIPYHKAYELQNTSRNNLEGVQVFSFGVAYYGLLMSQPQILFGFLGCAGLAWFVKWSIK